MQVRRGDVEEDLVCSMCCERSSGLLGNQMAVGRGSGVMASCDVIVYVVWSLDLERMPQSHRGNGMRLSARLAETDDRDAPMSGSRPQEIADVDQAWMKYGLNLLNDVSEAKLN